MIAEQNKTLFKALQWSVSQTEGCQFEPSDPDCLFKYFDLVEEKQDWLISRYWNEFAQAHNQFAKEDKQLPFTEAARNHHSPILIKESKFAPL